MADPVLNQPTLRKWMPLCQAVGDFKNGNQEGVLDLALFKRIIENQKKHPRQIPVYLITGTPDPEHPSDLDLMLADGWVEGLDIRGDWLYGDVKTHGNAAVAVAGDMVRGASIGTIHGKSYDGKPLGQVLEHVVLTNAPFVKGMNIAASRAKGGEPVAYHFSALPEADMADKKDPKDKDDPSPAAKAKVSNDDAPTPFQMKEAQDAITALQAENLTLKEKIDDLEISLANSKVDVDKEQLAKENLTMRSEVFGMKVRALVSDGLQRGTLKPAWCDGFAGKHAVDYGGTIQWLKASRFYDRNVPNPEDQAFRLLKWAVENNQPLYRTGASFLSGQPVGDTGSVSLTDAQRSGIRELGLDPDRIASMTDATNFTDWKRLKAEGGKS
jgi:FtsZ-binding cell division protein ZapB